MLRVLRGLGVLVFKLSWCVSEKVISESLLPMGPFTTLNCIGAVFPKPA